MRRVLILVVSLVAGAAHADLGDQLDKLLPDDGATSDNFGWSVAISGDTAIVGAFFDDDNGTVSGSAYLFDVATGQQLAKLLADDGAEGDFFGNSVAISGDTAIVGASGHRDNGNSSGSAYLFDVGTSQQLAKLLPDDGAEGDQFGFSVAISGNIAIVGARGGDDNGSDSGSAYLFDVGTSQQLAKLLPDDGAEFDNFGISVAISGNTAIIGAFFDNDNGNRSGSAYLFDVATGQQLAKLLPDDGARGDWFGVSVAVSGDTAIVGANDDYNPVSGSAYLFDLATGQQLAKLLPDDSAEGDFFGHSVAISGDTAIVGASGDRVNGRCSGSAYLFDVGTGQQLAKLLPDDGATDDTFGFSVAISGDTAIVGAHGDGDNGSNSGSAYLFDANRPCPADIDGDGDLDSKDFFAYLDLFAAGDDRADIDGDGDIDAEDFFGYLDLFAAGCG